MKFRTDQLITAIILIAFGIGQIMQVLSFSPGVLLICVGVWYILDTR